MVIAAGLILSLAIFFSQSGVSHVLALFGLHLAILFFFYQHIVLQSVRRRIWIALLSYFGT
ncbi:secreted protein, partial [gut metagenome]